MVEVEEYWFQVTLRGGAVPHRWNDPWQRDDESGDELIAIYQEVCESSRVVEWSSVRPPPSISSLLVPWPGPTMPTPVFVGS